MSDNQGDVRKIHILVNTFGHMLSINYQSVFQSQAVNQPTNKLISQSINQINNHSKPINHSA